MIDLSAEDLVLKLIVLKKGWVSREDWLRAENLRESLGGRKGLAQILSDESLLTPEQGTLVVEPLRRKEYLKELVEAEKGFWMTPCTRIGRYDVEGIAGEGGRAVVFRGHRDGIVVAIKVLGHAHAFDLEEVERFRRQGEFGHLLDHPNLVKVHELGTDGVLPYLVMQWVEGKPLSEPLEDGRGLRLEDLADWFQQAARGLGHAHAKGVLHLDVKPDNLLVDRVGHVVVTDFGVARRIGEAGEDGIVVGTPAYMSPEQAEGRTRSLDARADVYSLGASLYECLTREQPFRGEHRRAVLDAAAKGRFRHPRRLNPDIPPELEAVVLTAMARKPADRFPDMGAFEAALARWRSGGRAEPRRGWLGRMFGAGQRRLTRP